MAAPATSTGGFKLKLKLGGGSSSSATSSSTPSATTSSASISIPPATSTSTSTSYQPPTSAAAPLPSHSPSLPPSTNFHASPIPTSTLAAAAASSSTAAGRASMPPPPSATATARTSTGLNKRPRESETVETAASDLARLGAQVKEMKGVSAGKYRALKRKFDEAVEGKESADLTLHRTQRALVRLREEKSALLSRVLLLESAAGLTTIAPTLDQTPSKDFPLLNPPTLPNLSPRPRPLPTLTTGTDFTSSSYNAPLGPPPPPETAPPRTQSSHYTSTLAAEKLKELRESRPGAEEAKLDKLEKARWAVIGVLGLEGSKIGNRVERVLAGEEPEVVVVVEKEKVNGASKSSSSKGKGKQKESNVVRLDSLPNPFAFSAGGVAANNAGPILPPSRATAQPSIPSQTPTDSSLPQELSLPLQLPLPLPLPLSQQLSTHHPLPLPSALSTFSQDIPVGASTSFLNDLAKILPDTPTNARLASVDASDSGSAAGGADNSDDEGSNFAPGDASFSSTNPFPSPQQAYSQGQAFNGSGQDLSFDEKYPGYKAPPRKHRKSENKDGLKEIKPKKLKTHGITSGTYQIPFVVRNQDGTPRLPMPIGIMVLKKLGVIYPREHFHTERYIFPVGFESMRKYPSMVDPSTTVEYTCRIVDGQNGAPRFEIDPADQPGVIIHAGTPTGAWSQIVKAANRVRERNHSNSVSGPDYYGLAQNVVKALIQELPRARDVPGYIWQTFLEEPDPMTLDQDQRGKKLPPGPRKVVGAPRKLKNDDGTTRSVSQDNVGERDMMVDQQQGSSHEAYALPPLPSPQQPYSTQLPPLPQPSYDNSYATSSAPGITSLLHASQAPAHNPYALPAPALVDPNVGSSFKPYDPYSLPPPVGANDNGGGARWGEDVQTGYELPQMGYGNFGQPISATRDEWSEDDDD